MAAQEVAEPDDRVRVEVVRRLVEQQRVGAAEQDPRQLYPAPLAAGQGAQRLAEDAVRQTEARRHRCRLGLGGVPAEDVQPLLRRAVPCDRLLVAVGHRLLGGAQVGDDDVQPAAGQHPIAGQHVEVAGPRVLRQVADAAATLDRCRPPAGASPARTPASVVLPAPLRPTRPIRSPGADAEGGVLEQQAGAGAQLDTGGGEHGNLLAVRGQARELRRRVSGQSPPVRRDRSCRVVRQSMGVTVTGDGHDADACGSLLDPAYRLQVVGLVIVITVVAVEAMSVATVMPTVARALHGLRYYSWGFTAYLLADVIGMVDAGRRCDRHGPTPSLLGGLVAVRRRAWSWPRSAPDIGVFLAGRVLQGLGGGSMIVAAYVVVGRALPGARCIQGSSARCPRRGWCRPSSARRSRAWSRRRSSWRWVFAGIAPLADRRRRAAHAGASRHAAAAQGRSARTPTSASAAACSLAGWARPDAGRRGGRRLVEHPAARSAGLPSASPRCVGCFRPERCGSRAGCPRSSCCAASSPARSSAPRPICRSPSPGCTAVRRGSSGSR